MHVSSETVPSGPVRADWIGARSLFARLPAARALRRCPVAVAGRVVRIRFERSLPVEYIDEFLAPYLAAWGARLEVERSDYDPALPQVEKAADHDVRVLFVDWRLYRKFAPQAALAWIAERARIAQAGYANLKTVPLVASLKSALQEFTAGLPG